MRTAAVCVVLLACLASASYGARILGLFPLQGHSHWAAFKPLMTALAARGHQVTVMSHFPQKTPLPNYKDISIAGTLPMVTNNISYELVADMGLIGSMFFMWKVGGVNLCEALYTSPQVLELARSTEKYDLVITEVFGTDCFLSFVHKFKVPFIGMSSSVILPWGSAMIDLPDNPSYVPNYLVNYVGKMNFFERMTNGIILDIAKFGYHFVSRLPSQAIARGLFPDMPDLIDISHEMSLMITNSHFSLNGARPGVPALVEAGGMHIGATKPLPKDILDIIENSKEGVVYFSMGSMVKSETLPPAKVKAIIDAFGSVKQTVLWKADAALLPKDLPSNIITRKWMPQFDIICHPKVRAFITHGGLLGTQEAVHCGVPLIGIPLFGDQMLNIKTFVSRGIAIKISIPEINDVSFKSALHTILKDPSYKKNAEHMSKLFRDRPQSALDTAIYWTEYVINHKGAPHLRTAAKHLYLYQIYMLDIIGAILLGLFLIYFVSKKICKAVCGKKSLTKEAASEKKKN